jgi:molecular chaperone DnaK
MVKDAESHAADDKSRRELIDVRNQADALAYSVERTLNEHRGKMSAEDARRVENAISDVREALKGEDLGAIKRMSDALQQASHAMAEHMYKQKDSAPGSAQAQTPHAKDGEVIDAEVVDA